MKIYMPSYFNNLTERKEVFDKVIKAFLEKCDFEIIIYWMNNQSDKIIDKRIEYIDKEVANASIARNYLLDMFYESDDEYGIFCDDDTIMLNATIIESNDFDCISFIENKYGGITATEKINSSFMKIKNLNKKYKVKVYFDNQLDSNQDFDFGCNLKYHNISVGVVRTMGIQRNKGCSSMFKSNMDRIIKKEKSLFYVKNKWKNKIISQK